MLPARGIFQDRENVPFQALVISFSKRHVTLPKSRLIAVGNELPESLIAYDELALSSKTEEKEQSNTEESDARWAQIEQHHQVAVEDEKRMKHDWKQDIQVHDKF